MSAQEKGLPANVDAERFVLGSILLNDTLYVQAAGEIGADAFSLEKHRRIFRRMGELKDRGERIDRITIANELMKFNELEACDGLTYLVSLDDGLPQIPNVDSYIRIVKDKFVLRKIIFSGQRIQNRALLGEEEPELILADAGADFLNLAEGCAASSLVTPAGIVQEAGGIGPYIDRRNRTTGLATGYPALDVMTGGLKPGALYIVAARPAMGKTAFALNIVERVSVPTNPEREAQTSIVFSLEMTRQELLDRLICSRARINTQRFGGGYMTQDEERKAWRAVGEIAADERIFIDDKANTNSQEIHAKICKQQARARVGLVVVDYLQLMVNCKDSERVAAVSRLSRDMKLIARDCGVPMLVLSQLSRACELRGSPTNLDGYRPILSDLRESGSIEQDADVVGALFRGEVYLKDRKDLRGLAELELLKQRGGPIGRIPLTWLSEVVRFEERAVES